MTKPSSIHAIVYSASLYRTAFQHLSLTAASMTLFPICFLPTDIRTAFLRSCVMELDSKARIDNTEVQFPKFYERKRSFLPTWCTVCLFYIQGKKSGVNTHTYTHTPPPPHRDVNYASVSLKNSECDKVYFAGICICVRRNASDTGCRH